MPSAYQPLVTEIASGTGLPSGLVAAQANDESGFSATATSSAGAEGWLQFLPSTYDDVAAQAGVSPGTEFNPSDEAKAYIVYMNQLLQQEGGSIFKALEAYNAGPGNLSAGAGYATSIMAAANVPTSAQAGKAGTTTANTTSADFSIPNPLGSVGDIFTKPFEGILQWVGQSVFSAIGVPTLKDLLQRLALIALGFALLIIGIHMLANGGGSAPVTVNSSENDKQTSRTITTPVSKHTKVVGKTGAGEAAESAADA